MAFRLPKETDRTFIVGRTGQGKTQAGLWILAGQDWDKMPWCVLDFKRDDLLKQVIYPRAKQLKIDDDLPTEPGLYIIQSIPTEDAFQVNNDLLHRFWKHGNIGIFVDEGEQIAQMSGLRLIQKQGRSLRIPIIVIFQRPVGIKRDVLTEADFFMIFRLKHVDDRKAIGNCMEDEYRESIDQRLPDYHSWWYDDNAGTLTHVNPLPSIEKIERMYDYRLRSMKGESNVVLLR